MTGDRVGELHFGGEIRQDGSHILPAVRIEWKHFDEAWAVQAKWGPGPWRQLAVVDSLPEARSHGDTVVATLRKSPFYGMGIWPVPPLPPPPYQSTPGPEPGKGAR